MQGTYKVVEMSSAAKLSQKNRITQALFNNKLNDVTKHLYNFIVEAVFKTVPHQPMLL